MTPAKEEGRSKTKVNVRLSDDAIAIITTYKQEQKSKNFSEALESLIFRYGKEPEITIDTETQAFPCNRRIIYLNSYYCVNRPPKAVQLLTLDICKVCRIKQFGLTEATSIKSFYEGQQQPKEETKPYIPKRVYCEDIGDWVKKFNCERCRGNFSDRFRQCRNVKQFHLEEVEKSA